MIFCFTSFATTTFTLTGNYSAQDYVMASNHSIMNPSAVVRVSKATPLYLLLLPLFFVLHGVNSNFGSVPAGDATLLFFSYIAVSFLITGIGWFVYRDLIKTGLLTLVIMAYHFFFGSVQDTLKAFSPQTFLSQYRFILPASILLFIALVVWLRKRKKTLWRANTYLNILFLVLVLVDTFFLLVKTIKNTSNKDASVISSLLTPCDTCPKPDIFFILLDQYAGHSALKEVFDFDNTVFEQALTNRGFHIVPRSSSNYNLTPFSMASALEMDYLSEEMGTRKKLNVGYSYRVIRNNSVVNFLRAQGYDFCNYSVFDFPGQPAHEYGDFLPYGTKLITYQTFTSRLARDIRSGILEGKLGLGSIRRRIAYEYQHFNDTIFNLVKKAAEGHTGSPKFVYAHFMMPHYPYYFDSKGAPVPIEKLGGFRKTNSVDYIEYLQYGNGKILQLVDHILKSSANPPVIMLLSDHGFRHPGKKVDHRYDFINLNAIFLPNKNYSGFYDTMTNVNHFRVFLNTCFNQQLPMLKDSTIDLWD